MSFIMILIPIVSTYYCWESSKRHHFWRMCQGRARVAPHASPVPVTPFPEWVCLMSQEYSINQMRAAANGNVPKKINENLSTLYCFYGQSLFKIMEHGLFLFRLLHIRTNLHQKAWECFHAVIIHSTKFTVLYTPLSSAPKALPVKKLNPEGGTLSLGANDFQLNAITTTTTTNQ